MAKLTFILAILTTTIAISLCNAQLYIIEAGTSGKRMKDALKNGFTFCPSNFSSKGFSVLCVLPEGVKGANIDVNGKRQVEEYVPFLAAGNRGKTVYALKDIKAEILDVRCVGKDKTVHAANVTVACAKPAAPKPAPKPVPVPAPAPAKHSVPRTLATKKDEEPMEPPPMMVKEGPDTEPMKAAPVVTKKGGDDYCIYKAGTSHDNKPLPKGWVASGTSVTYKPGDPFGGTVPSNTAILTYKFKVKYTSTYAVTLDMGTKHNTEHNDVFVRCQGGFVAMKSNGDKFTAPGFVKAYHNRNGRAVQAFTKDRDAHALSTKMTFQAGSIYTCAIGARSTQTTIYGLVLFPCKEMECQAESSVWKTGIRKCAPQ